MPSYLTFQRSGFTVLILVLVNLQEVVHFNAEGETSPKCSELRGFRGGEPGAATLLRLEAHQPNLSEQKLKLLTH